MNWRWLIAHSEDFYKDYTLSKEVIRSLFFLKILKRDYDWHLDVYSDTDRWLVQVKNIK